MLTIKKCPTCKRNISLDQFQWTLGAKLPRDCPWCNKSVKKHEDKKREYVHDESKSTYHSWLKKGA